MTMTVALIGIVVAVTVPGGWIIVGSALLLIRKTLPHKDAQRCFEPLEFWLGSTERFIAMVLMLGTPGTLPTFIAGWTAAKIAANWARIKPDSSAYVRTGQLVALIGSALSFGLAIGGALLIEEIHG
jgi:hypothetical protein